MPPVLLSIFKALLTVLRGLFTPPRPRPRVEGLCRGVLVCVGSDGDVVFDTLRGLGVDFPPLAGDFFCKYAETQGYHAT